MLLVEGTSLGRRGGCFCGRETMLLVEGASLGRSRLEGHRMMACYRSLPRGPRFICLLVVGDVCARRRQGLCSLVCPTLSCDEGVLASALSGFGWSPLWATLAHTSEVPSEMDLFHSVSRWRRCTDALRQILKSRAQASLSVFVFRRRVDLASRLSFFNLLLSSYSFLVCDSLWLLVAVQRL
ncbi:hypothetical protein FB451DRAFT_4706 [Mycena latifolia]|nr:hypothetical protein FB451DRAFT_4706 [Mycena latifolia]